MAESQRYRLTYRTNVYVDVLYDEHPDEPDFEVLRVSVDDDTDLDLVLVDPKPDKLRDVINVIRDTNQAEWPPWEFGT